MQELGEAIAGRLLVTPVQAFSSFAIGSIEPTSNQGPWLRNCEEWFIWDDALGRYVPITKQGFNNREYHTESGAFVVPDFIYKLRVQVWGAGGGANVGGAAAGGGGGGAMASADLAVTPGQVINYTVGTGGMGGSPGTNGGDTTFLTVIGGGGQGSIVGNGQPGAGGLAAGGIIMMNGAPGGQSTGTNGGHGGASPQGGSGGEVNNVNIQSIKDGVVPGGGGSGGDGVGGPGNGAGGAVLIEY